MIDERLLDWEYYKKKLPTYIKDSYGLDEHFKYLVEILNQLDTTYDDIINIFNIFDDGYLDWINSLEGSEDGTVSEVLDLIGKIYGVNRIFDCTYLNVFFDDETHELSQTYTEPLTLTNSEFLKLIKATCIQQNYDGTYEQSREFYDSIDLPIVLFENTSPASSLVYLALTYDIDGKRTDNFTDNELKMFMSGLFTLKSVGIIYTYRLGNVQNVFIWDSDVRLWDVGVWA